MDKYLSIITNFGCHYSCPYCIVKNNNIQVPATTLSGLDNLETVIKENNINMISLSGGGDPLFEYEKHKQWYKKLFKIAEKMNVGLEMHTSYIKKAFPVHHFKRIVYHLHSIKQLNDVWKYSVTSPSIMRVVFVVTKDMTVGDLYYIAGYCAAAWPRINELSFRQCVGENYEIQYNLHDILLAEHKKLWWYIQQDDYNLYYAENKVYHKYSDFMEVN